VVYLSGADASPVQAETATWYDGQGNVTRREDAEGAATSYYYNARGRLTRQTDPSGAHTDTLYDAFGKATRVTDASGAYVETVYDSEGRALTRIRRSSGDVAFAKSSFTYDGLGRQTEQRQWYDPTSASTHASDVVARTAYDGNGMVTRSLDALGNATDYLYDADDRATRTTFPDGSFTASFYDAMGRLTRSTDQAGAHTDYLYDAEGRTTRVLRRDGGDTLLAYSESVYDALGRVTASVQRSAADTGLARSHTHYDALGRVTQSRRLADPSSATESATNDTYASSYYDRAGRTTRTADALGHASDTAYDKAGRATRVTDAVSNYASTYYDGEGRLSRTVDKAGAQAVYTYDTMGRATKVERKDAADTLLAYAETLYDGAGRVTAALQRSSVGTALARSRSYYDGLGRTTKQRAFADPTSAVPSDANDTCTVYFYDVAGRRTRVEDALGNATGIDYDAMGRATRTTDALGNYAALYYDAGGRTTRTTSYEIDMTDASGHTFVADVLYDAMGRVTKTTGQGADGDIEATADNPVTITYYDAAGRATRRTDAEGHHTDTLYDGLGRRTKQIEDAGGLDRDTSYAYDRTGRQTRITDDLGQNTDYAYDGLDRVTRTTYENHDAADDTVDLVYDAAGRVVLRTDQRGVVQVSEFDALGQLTRRQDAESSPTVVERLAYDALGRRTSALKGTDANPDAESETARWYDGLGRMTRESQEVAESTARVFSHFYDRAGNRTRLAYPGASRVVSYTYDALNRLSLVQDGSTPKTVAQHLYVGPSRLSERRYNKASDGSTEVTTLEVSYDGARMVTRWEHLNATPATVVGFAYARDKVGNPAYELRLHQSNEGDEYTYDGLYRVTGAVYDDAAPATPTAPTAGSGADILYYDGVGNRTRAYLKSATETDYVANAVNEYTDVGGVAWEHDAAGNLTKDDGRYYYWDYRGQLTRVTDQEATPNVLAEFRYDAEGRRIEKVSSGTTTRYYLDGARIVEETEGTGSPTVERQYVYGRGVDDVLVLFDKDGESYDAYYYLKDPLWSAEALVDEDAAVAEAYAYALYGAPTIKTGDGGDGDWFDGDETTATTSALGNPYLFTARRWDADLSLQYNRARYYQPATGRWISRDPLGYVDGMGLYEYVQSEPVAFADPLGIWTRLDEDTHVYCAEKGDTLTGLAKTLTGRTQNWTCLWPVDGTEDHGYPDVIQPGDHYDASNLAKPAPRATQYRVIVAHDVLSGYRSVFGEDTPYLRADKVAKEIRRVSGQGKTPIEYLLVAGHSGGYGISGGKYEKGSVGDGKKAPHEERYRFSADSLLKLEEPATFARAKAKHGTVRCWFTRDAEAWLVGCRSSKAAARPFASKILREGAVARGSNQNLAFEDGEMYWGKEERRGKVTWHHHGPWRTAPVWVSFPGSL